MNKKTGRGTQESLTNLKRDDLRISDNSDEMPIEGFDKGAEHPARSIALWLIVQCNDAQPPSHHSMFMRRRTDLLKPALTQLAAAMQLKWHTGATMATQRAYAEQDIP
jgi:hypothetical protein